MLLVGPKESRFGGRVGYWLSVKHISGSAVGWSEITSGGQEGRNNCRDVVDKHM